MRARSTNLHKEPAVQGPSKDSVKGPVRKAAQGSLAARVNLEGKENRHPDRPPVEYRSSSHPDCRTKFWSPVSLKLDDIRRYIGPPSGTD